MEKLHSLINHSITKGQRLGDVKRIYIVYPLFQSPRMKLQHLQSYGKALLSVSYHGDGPKVKAFEE